MGASLFWIDPTHVRPLLPETLELFLVAGGFSIERTELLHPFPAEQLFSSLVGDAEVADPATTAVLDRLGRRLDELVHGSRDVAVWARNPATEQH